MGNASSRAEENPLVFLRDQNRLAITSVKITNSRNRVLYTIVPNAFPATRFTVRREADDETPIEYIQDPDVGPSNTPNFLLRLSNDEDIYFYFTFLMRQTQAPSSTSEQTTPTDTAIDRLTFLYASNTRELDTLVTREFNADPNLHKNPNVDLVGDYNTAGKPVEQFEWSWKWRAPKQEKDKGGGWRTSCSFVEYDQRAHKLNTLVSFSFWVNNIRIFGSPKMHSRFLEPVTAPRLRVPSTVSVESRLSDSDTEFNYGREPPSPGLGPTIPEDGLIFENGQPSDTIKVDINYQKPGEDVSAIEDGPVFRSTMKLLEQKTGNMRIKMKQVLRRAESAKESQIMCNRSVAAFVEALKDASHSNANAVQPALDHYFEKIATEILANEKQNAENLQKLIIEPLSRFYSNEIKQVDSKKKDFDDESKDYYAYVGKYLGQRQDSLKEKKRAESDAKYLDKRKNFELKRFDYSSFMQDLHGGRKDQEVLSQLTSYAETQAKGYLSTAKKIELMMPQLEALIAEVKEADKEYQLIRTDREEKRRTLEKGVKSSEKIDPAASFANGGSVADADPTTLDSTQGLSSTADKRRSFAAPRTGLTAVRSADAAASGSPRSIIGSVGSSPGHDRFKGYRDLEEKDPAALANGPGSHRKEGLLWSLTRGNHYVDPKNLNKQAWHKYWIVLDQGRLSEYVNWKDVMEQNRDPIDLRMASVREARNAERRFCFEVITPNSTRVYQAPSEDEMRAWISAVNNALQSAFESKSPLASTTSSKDRSSKAASIGRDLFGKASSFHGHRTTSSSNNANSYLGHRHVARHATVGDGRPQISRSRSSEDHTARLVQTIRNADVGNTSCADCNSEARVEWVSINLGVIVCIECSGIHRSLGTHITRIRSLTLDTTSFTQDITELLLRIGNRVSNLIYEATLDQSSDITKLTAASTRDARSRFITAKYVQKTFVAPSQKAPNDLLLSSIKTQNLPNTVHALALNASPNATDKVRATPAVILALAAADPAAPGASPQPSSTTSATPGSATTERKSFPIAELLIQNGAEIPTSNPPIPLGASAWAYLEYKRGKRDGSGSGSGITAPGGGFPAGGPGPGPRAITPTPPGSSLSHPAPTVIPTAPGIHAASATAAVEQALPLRYSSLAPAPSIDEGVVGEVPKSDHMRDEVAALPRFHGPWGGGGSGSESGNSAGSAGGGGRGYGAGMGVGRVSSGGRSGNH